MLKFTACPIVEVDSVRESYHIQSRLRDESMPSPNTENPFLPSIHQYGVCGLVGSILSQRGELDHKTYRSDGGKRYTPNRFSWLNPYVATVQSDDDLTALKDQHHLKGVD